MARSLPAPATALAYVPVTVITITALAGMATVYQVDLFDYFTRSWATLVNPLYHLASLFVHENWAHFEGNAILLVPLGTLLTLLTGERHVLMLVVTSHLLASVVAGVTRLSFGIGASAAVLAVAAAVLVHLVGDVFAGASAETRQSAVVGLLAPIAVALFVLVVLLGGGRIGHFAHFLGFLFGGAIEAMYVLGEE